MRTEITKSSAVSAAEKWSPLGFSVAVTSVFFIDVCAWFFACGCRSLWAGADAFCNVHASVPPHCPFCARGVPGYALVFGLVCLPQWAASAWLPGGLVLRAIACLALFPVSMIAVGLAFGWWDAYW
jgi:hypothetical protein